MARKMRVRNRIRPLLGLWAVMAVLAAYEQHTMAALDLNVAEKPPAQFNTLLVSQGPYGSCLFNPASGEIFYEEPEDTLSRYRSEKFLNRKPIFFGCRKDSVIVVESQQITWVDLLAAEKTKFHLGAVVEESSPAFGQEDAFLSSITWAVDEGLSFVDAVDFQSELVLLGRNSSENVCNIDHLKPDELTLDTYEVKFPCTENSVLERLDDLFLAISQAKKGQTYLLAFKIKDDLRGYSFEAMEEVSGKIQTAHSADKLLVKSGEAVIEISSSRSEKKVPESDNIGCFTDPASAERYVCVTQENLM
jgi:hypothetical protein